MFSIDPYVIIEGSELFPDENPGGQKFVGHHGDIVGKIRGVVIFVADDDGDVGHK